MIVVLLCVAQQVGSLESNAVGDIEALSILRCNLQRSFGNVGSRHDRARSCCRNRDRDRTAAGSRVEYAAGVVVRDTTERMLHESFGFRTRDQYVRGHDETPPVEIPMA